MTSDDISEAGRKERFARWEQIGVDVIKTDLINGGYRLVGGPPAVKDLAWKWVRMKEAEEANRKAQRGDELTPAYTMDAAKAVYAAIETLVSAGKRAYSLSVQSEAESILIKQGGGKIASADASCDIKAAIVGLARDGMIEAYAEGRKDWLIKKPLTEQPKPDASQDTASKSIPTEKSPVFILKPQAWGVGIDLNEAGRRIKSWLKKWQH